MRFQAARLPGEHQWRVPAQARFHLLQLRRVRIGRDLADRAIAPGIRVPRTRGRGAGRRGGRHDGLLSLDICRETGEMATAGAKPRLNRPLEQAPTTR